MEDLLLVIVRGLASKPELVRVEVDDSAEDGLVVYRLRVDESDMGRVIGKQGRIAKSIRQIVKATSINKRVRAAVEIG